MNLLTAEQQAAYKQGISTMDILHMVQNSIRHGDAHQLIRIYLPKDDDSIKRNAIWAILYQQGLPWKLSQQLKMGHKGTKLRAKHDGTIGKDIRNKGVFR